MDWERHKTELDRIFFKNFPLIPRQVPRFCCLKTPLFVYFSRGSREHTDFWSFLRRYEKFQSKLQGGGDGEKKAKGQSTRPLCV